MDCVTEYLVASLAVGVVLFIAVLLLLRLNSQKIFGIYPSKGFGYHLKYVIALLVLKKLRHKIYKRHANILNTPEYMSVLDRPQILTENPKSYDVVSFMAANMKGEKCMITLERRRRGINKACLYLWLPDYGLLASPKLPDMLYFTTDGDEESTEFKGNGFHIYPLEPMKLWCIAYEGEMEQVSEKKLLQVKLKLNFESSFHHFDYNRDLSASLIADSVAREAWNESFYIMLKNVDKILEKRHHYEQCGCLTGDINIDHHMAIPLKLKGIRDHSFGTERSLSTVRRYVYFSLFLEDGSSMVVGNLSQPSFFLSSLKVGYICTKEGSYEPLTQCNFELYTYGEKGIPPKHQNFIVKTEAKSYFVQIKVDDEAVRYLGGNWESKAYNQFFKCTVNGVPGHGLTEYLYRNNGGRPEEVCQSDPEWYQRIRKFERNLSTCENVEDDEVFFF